MGDSGDESSSDEIFFRRKKKGGKKEKKKASDATQEADVATPAAQAAFTYGEAEDEPGFEYGEAGPCEELAFAYGEVAGPEPSLPTTASPMGTTSMATARPTSRSPSACSAARRSR